MAPLERDRRPAAQRTPDVELLFVYGTLMAAAGGALGRGMRARLATESEMRGPAALRGCLHDLGRYPGAAPCLHARPHCRCCVHGELVRLHDPSATLRWLDRYEGIIPGHPGGEYARAVVVVTGPDGGLVRAWAYLLGRPRRARRRIASGRWLERSRHASAAPALLNHARS